MRIFGYLKENYQKDILAVQDNVKQFLNQIKRKMNNLNYERVFNYMVDQLEKYLYDNNLKSMVIGISGGIDSTVTAAICHQVSLTTGIPVIGRSLPIKNKNDENRAAAMVGCAFCSDFEVCNLNEIFGQFTESIGKYEGLGKQTPIANGNIQARLRMIYLYNLASINNGLVMSTDNLTEYYLGFWTLHGDVGDFGPIQRLWKTEVYKLALFIWNKCITEMKYSGDYHCRMTEALQTSINLTPTDGLGISNSDLDQIGAKSYTDVDKILQAFLEVEITCGSNHNMHDKVFKDLCAVYPKEVIENVINRWKRSEFKRNVPINILRCED